MKILFYNHTGQVGGAERVLLVMLSRLDRASFEPVLVCPDAGPLRKLAADLGIQTEPLPSLEARFTWRLDYLIRYLNSFAEVILHLRKQVISLQPDLIHANSVRAGLVATLATAGLGQRVVWHIHDLLPRHPFNPLIRVIALLSARTRMIAVAEASARRFTGSFAWLKKRLTIIRNGIEVAEFKATEAARQKIRTELQVSEGEPVVGIVGRITESKGQMELLRAFPRLLNEFPSATLVIVGAPAFNREHEYLQLLRQTASELGISDHVRMLGARDDVPAIMRALDLLVTNSSVEACCLVILEAMACGTPVLATSTGGTPEIIKHGTNGWLVPWRDEDALAVAMVKLLSQPALRQQLVEQARTHVATNFHIDRFMAQIQNFYLEWGAESVNVTKPSQTGPTKTAKLAWK